MKWLTNYVEGERARLQEAMVDTQACLDFERRSFIRSLLLHNGWSSEDDNWPLTGPTKAWGEFPANHRELALSLNPRCWTFGIEWLSWTESIINYIAVKPGGRTPTKVNVRQTLVSAGPILISLIRHDVK